MKFTPSPGSLTSMTAHVASPTALRLSRIWARALIELLLALEVFASSSVRCECMDAMCAEGHEAGIALSS